MMRALVIVMDERAVADERENRAGPILAERLEGLGCEVAQSVCGSDRETVRRALEAALASHDVVVTAGGTGIRPGDCVVDETRALGLAELPGIGEEVRRRGAEKAPASLLSRTQAGVVTVDGRRVLVVNAPSSRGGARDVTAVLAELWPHLVGDLVGADRW